MAILELKGITKSFNGLRVLDEVSISVEPGKITGLIGPNGAGKTTLFNVISGVLPPDRGEIVFKGELLNYLPPWQRARLGVGRLWQDVRVFEGLTVLENVLVARKDHPGEGVLGNFARIPAVRRCERDNLAQARHWLGFVGLSEKECSPAGELSCGQQKLLALARLLANDADLLLLDEPTSGIHPELIGRIVTLMRRIAKEGKTVVAIEHNFGLVREFAEWLHVLDKGRIKASGRPDEMAKAPFLREVYLGT